MVRTTAELFAGAEGCFFSASALAGVSGFLGSALGSSCGAFSSTGAGDVSLNVPTGAISPTGAGPACGASAGVSLAAGAAVSGAVGEDVSVGALATMSSADPVEPRRVPLSRGTKTPLPFSTVLRSGNWGREGTSFESDPVTICPSEATGS